MSQQWSRNAEKEAFWRSHIKRQSSSCESIRGYCLQRGLSEASFHFWRREIASRDREARPSQHVASAGLVAVEILGASSVQRQMIEIECPGGPVIRLREDVCVEVLQHVLQACQLANISRERESVRSC